MKSGGYPRFLLVMKWKFSGKEFRGYFLKIKFLLPKYFRHVSEVGNTAGQVLNGHYVLIGHYK